MLPLIFGALKFRRELLLGLIYVLIIFQNGQDSAVPLSLMHFQTKWEIRNKRTHQDYTWLTYSSSIF
jgi:hypothetical protein